MNSNLWLEGAGRRVARLDAELILAHVLGCRREDLHAHPERELTLTEVEEANRMLERRAAGEPVAYLVGRKEFFGRNFVVNTNVLVPRPETEAVVEAILDLKPKRLLDVGTGSGVIAISVALELPETEVVAVDVSPEALGVAQENARRLGAVGVSFLQSDLFSGLEGAHGRPYEVVVANLPYVDKGWEWNAPELRYEPEGALYAGDGGLEIIKKLMLAVSEYLSENGRVVLEADVSQHEEIRGLAGACGLELERVLGLALVLRRRL